MVSKFTLRITDFMQRRLEELIFEYNDIQKSIFDSKEAKASDIQKDTSNKDLPENSTLNSF